MACSCCHGRSFPLLLSLAGVLLSAYGYYVEMK